MVKRKENVLLNGDDHANYITNKLRKDPAEYRPDITHQSLLTLMDSPLNKAGKLQVFITTQTNQVIKIHPSTRIPRTYKRFAALFAQLLKRLSIRAEENSQILLEVVKSPVNQHLPEDCLKIGFETTARFVPIAKLAK
jgi:rRNA small subunit pseudouridine methyltransferase Nep1